MKYLWMCFLLISLSLGHSAPISAVTVYFKDGTQLEVDSITRIGNSVCLFVDISRIDSTRTPMKEFTDETPSPQQGLTVSNVDFSPTADNTEIIATGEVINNSRYPVQRVGVTVILKNKNDQKLLTVQGYVRPDKLLPGQRGSYRMQVKKPTGFWKAGVEVHGEAIR